MRIASIGCGTGQATVLNALKILARKTRLRLEVSAIVGVTDNGGHSGLLRGQLSIPQVGDTRACLVAAARNPLLAGLLDFRFSRGRLKGACLGNLLLATETVRRGSLVEAAMAFSRTLGEVWTSAGRLKSPLAKGDLGGCSQTHDAGLPFPIALGSASGTRESAAAPDNFIDIRVIPVSDQSGEICAELVSGRAVRGEWQIIKRRPRTAIRRLFHKPRIDAHPWAVAAVRGADVVVVAPGSLRTGIVSVLLARGMHDALAGSGARVVYVSNIMTQSGQTDGFTLADHVAELGKYLGRAPMDVVVNIGKPSDRLLEYYRATGCSVVQDEPISGGVVVHRTDMVLNPAGRALARLGRAGTGRMHAGPHFIRHDPAKLARVLGSILGV